MCTRLTSVQFKWVFTQCFWAHAYREFIGNSQSKNSALTEYFKKCDDKTLLIWQNSVNLLVYEFHHSRLRSNSVDCLRFIWIISNTFTTLQCHSSIVPNPLIGLFVKKKWSCRIFVWILSLLLLCFSTMLELFSKDIIFVFIFIWPFCFWIVKIFALFVNAKSRSCN